MASTAARLRSLALILAGLALAVGTPAFLAFTYPGIRGYLAHAILFAAQALPYLLAALLWLPRFLRLSSASIQALAVLLFLSAAALYVPMLTGLVPMGGDMVGLAFMVTAAGTIVGVVMATVVAVGVQWLQHLGQR